MNFTRYYTTDEIRILKDKREPEGVVRLTIPTDLGGSGIEFKVRMASSRHDGNDCYVSFYDMPLLVISGFPASGKSMICSRLKENFLGRSFEKVIVVEDAIEHRRFYGDFKKEKECRNFLRSEVQRFLSKDVLVICDSLNYIKGFRYELFCVAKNIATTYAVLHCQASSSTCKWLNDQRPEANRYPADVFSDLVKRYETPDSKNRWDSPLFEVEIGGDSHDEFRGNLFQKSEDFGEDFSVDSSYSKPPSSSSTAGELGNVDERFLPRNASIPLDELYTCLIKGESLKSNVATQNLAPKAPATFLHELDRVTQRIVATVVEKQRNALPGDKLTICGVDGAEGGKVEGKQVVFTKQRTLSELTRLRNQFITYTKMHPTNDFCLISSLFIDFLNSNS